jgi:hypothetical protein
MKPVCSVDGCTRVAFCRGWCGKHYTRWRKHGDPTVLLAGGEESERFWRKVDKAGPVPEYRPELGPCWIWTGGLTGAGYGGFACEPRKADGRLSFVCAHRYAYEQVVGPIPDGMFLDHLCRVTQCVNPGHLEPVTMAENFRRGAPSVSAINREKTHCIHGHPLSGDNLWIYAKTGQRHCRTCMRQRTREWKARRDAQANASKEEAALARTGPEVAA